MLHAAHELCMSYGWRTGLVLLLLTSYESCCDYFFVWCMWLSLMRSSPVWSERWLSAAMRFVAHTVSIIGFWHHGIDNIFSFFGVRVFYSICRYVGQVAFFGFAVWLLTVTISLFCDGLVTHHGFYFALNASGHSLARLR